MNWLTPQDILHAQNKGILVWETFGLNHDQNEIHTLKGNVRTIFDDKEDYLNYINNKSIKIKTKEQQWRK